MAAAPSLSPAMVSEVLGLPAATAPPGATSNLIDPPSSWDSAAATLIICSTLTTLAIFIRLYTKGVIMRKFLLEDYTILVGWLLFLGEEIPAFVALQWGNGEDLWNVTVGNLIKTLHANNTVMIFYCLSTMFIKIAILLQYLRIFVPSPQHARFTYIAIWATVAAITVYYVTMTGFLIGLCNPREKIWDVLIAEGSCFNVYTLIEASGILNIVTDCIIFVLPISCIWKLQMARKKKIGVTAVFALGFFGIVASILRCYYSFVLAITDDETYVITFLGIWAAIECTVGVIVCCMPVLPRFYENLRPKVSSLISSSRGKSSNVYSSAGSESHRMDRIRDSNRGDQQQGQHHSRSAGSRKLGLSDPWNESVFDREKQTPLASSYQIDQDARDLEWGDAIVTVADDGSDVRYEIPYSHDHRGHGPNEIWQTTSIELEVEARQHA